MAHPQNLTVKTITDLPPEDSIFRDDQWQVIEGAFEEAQIAISEPMNLDTLGIDAASIKILLCGKRPCLSRWVLFESAEQLYLFHDVFGWYSLLFKICGQARSEVVGHLCNDHEKCFSKGGRDMVWAKRIAIGGLWDPTRLERVFVNETGDRSVGWLGPQLGKCIDDPALDGFDLIDKHVLARYRSSPEGRIESIRGDH